MPNPSHLNQNNGLFPTHPTRCLPLYRSPLRHNSLEPIKSGSPFILSPLSKNGCNIVDLNKQTSKNKQTYLQVRFTPQDIAFQKKEYKLNLRTRKCNVTDLLRPFRPFEVPGFAKLDFEAEVGPASKPGEHMTVQEWEAEFSNKGKESVSL